MLRLKSTYEEMLRETNTRRSRILPERERRTQQGILLDEIDFNGFDLDNCDKVFYYQLKAHLLVSIVQEVAKARDALPSVAKLASLWRVVQL